MPCCHSLLSAAAAASSRSTPSWLHRLHAKGGLSIPSHLHIDDLLYGQPPLPLPLPPPSSPSTQQLVVVQEQPLKVKHPKHKQQQRHAPRGTKPSRPNPSAPHLSAVVSDLFVIPSDLPPPLPLKAFRKQHRPRPRAADGSPCPRKDKKDRPKKDKAKGKVRKRRRAERAADVDGERFSKTEVTVIDTSTHGWKAAKLLIRKGPVWKVRDKKASAVPEPEDPSKGKRRAGLVSKLQRDREKEKEKEKEKETTLVLQGNILAISEDVMDDSDDPIPIQIIKRPRCSEPVPEGQSSGILNLQTTNKGKKNGLTSPKGDLKGK